MPNIAPARVQDAADVDPRVARSTHALGRALIELLQERDFDAITVQHILDRARVGRATFYAHYRNKEDALQSSYERLFAAFEPMLARSTAAGPRLFPVAELLEHLAESGRVVEALHRAGRLGEVWELFVGHAARLIERRLACWPGVVPAAPRPLAARMLAGALVEAISWCQDHPAAATPAQMDAAFHELARGMLRRAR
jgi:AcrR family transcriptional regulator